MTDLSLSDRIRGIKIAELTAETGVSATPATQKTTPILSRTPKGELESAFRFCGVVNKGIIKLVQIIMSGEPKLICDDKKVLKYFEDFTKNIGNRGNDLHWDELLNRMFLDQFIYGEAWVEKIWNLKHNRITDLDIVDAKTMDYGMRGEKIALDKFGIPIGYTQEIPFGQRDVARKAHKAPEGINLEGNKQWIPRDYIAHFGLYNFGSGFRPIGLIEPAYQDILVFMNMKKCYGDKVLSILLPKYVGTHGDEKHVPTAEGTKELINKMKESQYNTEIALPYYNNIKVLQANHPDALLNFLGFFQDEIVISLGMPKPIATGLGEETNRATLNVQTYLLILSTRDIIKRTVRTIERQIFRPMAIGEKFGTEKEPKYPTIDWNFQNVENAISGSVEGKSNGNPKEDESKDEKPEDDKSKDED